MMNYFDALAAMQKPQNSVWSNAGLFNTAGYLPGLFDMQYQPRIDGMPLFAGMRYHPLSDALPGMTDLPYLPYLPTVSSPQPSMMPPPQSPKFTADNVPPVERLPLAPIEDHSVQAPAAPKAGPTKGLGNLGLGLLNESLNPKPQPMMQFPQAAAHRGQYIPIDQFLGLLGGNHA